MKNKLGKFGRDFLDENKELVMDFDGFIAIVIKGSRVHHAGFLKRTILGSLWGVVNEEKKDQTNGED